MVSGQECPGWLGLHLTSPRLRNLQISGLTPEEILLGKVLGEMERFSLQSAGV